MKLKVNHKKKNYQRVGYQANVIRVERERFSLLQIKVLRYKKEIRKYIKESVNLEYDNSKGTLVFRID